MIRLTVLIHMDGVRIEVINTLELLTHADRPVDRRTANLENRLDLIEQLDRIASVAIQLIDEGEDRRIAQATNIHQLDGALFHALGAVDYHECRVHGCQHTIGVFRKVFVSGRV